MSADLAIRVRGLKKSFGEVCAVDGVDLDVPAGTVLGLLGPNGAGKTTVVRMLTTLMRPDAGEIDIIGINAIAEPGTLRAKIGLAGQYAAVDESLTGIENLIMVGRLYGMSRSDATARATELLERFSLTEAGGRPTKGYSGGMRRRLDLAAALVAQPPVLFLDEPTTGLDPRSRIELWEVIEGLVAGGTTVLLTTQYLDEADRLAHEIAVIDHGKLIAQGTADQLKDRIGGERLEVRLGNGQDPEPAIEALASMAVERPAVHDGAVTLPLRQRSGAIVDAVRRLDEAGVDVDDIGLRTPTLDDVFLTLTGRATEAGDDEEGETR